MKLIKKGAEGDLYLSRFNNKPTIIKIRKKKDYRNPILDTKIRKQRTIRESEIISQVKSFGISTPLVYYVDSRNYAIFLQHIPGRVVSDLPDLDIVRVCKKIGNVVGLMHNNGIMHGDLTTSNFILYNSKLFVIDFGLANRTSKPEDHAIDLRLFKEILNSAHVHIMEKAWKNFLIGYSSVMDKKEFSKIIELVETIESRGRYATVV